MTGSVFDHTRFLVEDAVRRHGATLVVTRHGHLQLEVSVTNHPREQFECIARGIIRWFERVRGEMAINGIAQ